jgi:hypothetical protein
MRELVFLVMESLLSPMSSQRVTAGLKRVIAHDVRLGRPKMDCATRTDGHDEITDAVRSLLCGAATLFRD